MLRGKKTVLSKSFDKTTTSYPDALVIVSCYGWRGLPSWSREVRPPRGYIGCNLPSSASMTRLDFPFLVPLSWSDRQKLSCLKQWYQNYPWTCRRCLVTYIRKAGILPCLVPLLPALERVVSTKAFVERDQSRPSCMAVFPRE